MISNENQLTPSRVLLFVDIQDGIMKVTIDEVYLNEKYSAFKTNVFAESFYSFLIEKGINISLIQEINGVVIVFELNENLLACASSGVLFEEDEYREVSDFLMTQLNIKENDAGK